MSKSCALPKSVFPVKFKVKSPIHALELARQLIRPFKHWTTGALAVEEVYENGNTSEHEIEVKSPKAEAFCALGALLRVNTKHAAKAEEFLRIAAYQINNGERPTELPEQDEIFSLNDAGYDRECHRTVLKMFTKAIALAKKAAKVKK